MRLSNHWIVWQQCNADTGQELYLMFTSTFRMGKKCDHDCWSQTACFEYLCNCWCPGIFSCITVSRIYSMVWKRKNVVADHVHPIMAIMYPSSNRYFQHDNAPCHKAKVISNRFHEHVNEFNVLQWSSQSLDLNPIQHLWDVARTGDSQHECTVDKSAEIAWCNHLNMEQCFRHLVESMPQRIEAVLRAKALPSISIVQRCSQVMKCKSESSFKSLEWCSLNNMTIEIHQGYWRNSIIRGTHKK